MGHNYPESLLPLPAGPQATAHQVRPQAQRWAWFGVLAGLMALHGWQTLRLFPSWQAFTDDRPVIAVDHAIHLYHGYLGARFLKEHGTSWGYDPFFMAGYPKTPVYDSSSAPTELFELAAGGGYSPRAYKFGVAFLVWLVPLVLVLAARAYGSGPVASLAAAVWTIMYWWIGYPDTVMVRAGIVAFPWSSALAVLLPGLLVRWGRRPRLGSWLSLSAAAAVGVQAHALFAVMVLVPVAIGYAWLSSRRVAANTANLSPRPGWRWHAATWAALAAALALTCFWWWPLLRFLPLKTASTMFMKAEYWGFVRDYYLFTVYSDAELPLFLAAFGLLGLVRWWRSGRRLETTVLGFQIVLLSLLVFAGSMWRVTLNLEPLRFQVPMCLAWSVPAGEGICATLAALDPRWLVGPHPARLRWGGAVALAIASLLVSTPGLCWRLVAGPRGGQPASTWQVSWARLRAARPVAVGLRPEMEQLVGWINQNTDSSARILFEDQLRLWETVEAESLHWTPLLPLLTGREYVGGLYHMAFIPHQRAAFGDWHLGGTHIQTWTPAEIRAFCEQYNIGWVVTWSRASRLKREQHALSTDVFASLPFCELIATLPRHSTRPDENRTSIFRVRREHSFFATGRGRVDHADYNRIELADLQPENGRLVLRYHWQHGLRAEPAVPIERVETAGDPVGFILIRADQPLPRLTLRNAYR